VISASGVVTPPLVRRKTTVRSLSGVPSLARSRISISYGLATIAPEVNVICVGRFETVNGLRSLEL
jgi:hypothetical protein